MADDERDPNGIPPGQPGSKMDAGKAPLWRGLVEQFPIALQAVAQVSEFGAQKYVWSGWKSVPDGAVRYGNAMMRHAVADAAGGRYDPDSGLLHAAHVAWNALARLELIHLEAIRSSSLSGVVTEKEDGDHD